MKIAIPMVEGELSLHFGHCQNFVIYSVDDSTKKVTGEVILDPPAHEPGVLPRWLAEQGASVIISGGMGLSAQTLFEQNNIEVVVGAPSKNTKEIVEEYLAGKLATGANGCSH